LTLNKAGTVATWTWWIITNFSSVGRLARGEDCEGELLGLITRRRPIEGYFFAMILRCGINSSARRAVVDGVSDVVTQLGLFFSLGYVAVNKQLAIRWTYSSRREGERNPNLGNEYCSRG
jgi:hypothetical protein